MKSKITAVAAALAIIACPELGDARKQLVSADEQRLETRQSPVVSTETCQDRCIYGKSAEEKTYWCFMFKEPILKTGWSYKQTANTDKGATPLKYFRWDLIFYTNMLFQVTSTIDIFRLYYNRTILEMPQLDWKLNIGFIINEKGRYCPHVSWDRSTFTTKVTYRQEFMNCSKIFVKNLWDVENVWTGKYAKWFEDCQRSQAGSATSTNAQVTATLWTKDWLKSSSDNIWIGTNDPTSVAFCYGIPLVSAPDSENLVTGGPTSKLYNQVY